MQMHMHIELHDTNWRSDLILPLVLIAVPMLVSVIGPGEWLIFTFPVSAIAGYLFTPRHLWLVWLGSAVMLWAVYGGANLLGWIEPVADDPAQGETIWSFATESFIFTAGLVFLPLWFGRFFNRRGF
jgi:hypothetical protein